jgi:SnoaL-like protein
MIDTLDVAEEALRRAEDEWCARALLGRYALWASTAAGATELAVHCLAGATADVDGVEEPVLDGYTSRFAAAGGTSPWYVHTLGPARVDLDGDRAVSTHYERVHGPASDGSVELLGFGYGRWELARTADSWRLARSRTRSTGRDDAMAVLREELPDASGRAGVPVLGAPPGSVGARVQRLLDEFAILNVIATYGIAADGGSAANVGDLYTVDTDVDIEGAMFMKGRAGVEAMINDAPHQSLLPWAGHTMGPAIVDIEGDTATATHYARIYGRTSDASSDMVDPRATGDRGMWRFGYNRWHLVREADGRWRIATRVSRSPRHHEAQDLLRHAVTAPAPPPATAPASVLDRRTAAIEDGLAVERVLTAYAMALDAGAPDAARAHFAHDATILHDGALRTVDEVGTSPLAGVDTIGHLVGPGTVTISGDAATATQVVGIYTRPPGHGPRVARLSWNRWELRRASDGAWIVTREESCAAGSAAATELVRRGLDDAG